jgi:hypothetical protein
MLGATIIFFFLAVVGIRTLYSRADVKCHSNLLLIPLPDCGPDPKQDWKSEYSQAVR